MQQSTTAKGIASRGMQAQLHSPIMHQAVVYFQMRDFHDSISIFLGKSNTEGCKREKAPQCKLKRKKENEPELAG